MNKPRKFLLAACSTAAFAGLLALPSASSGQAPAVPAANPAAANEQQAIATLIAEVADQQAKITANQKLIEEKLAAVAEDLRIARIYVSRGGGK